MPIIEPVIRPPAEAESFLLQITTGCSANHCTFCGAYMNKPFSIKNDDEIFLDIELGKKYYPNTRRVFLMDGDALATKNLKLITILKKLELSFPTLTRVSSYANGYNITTRSHEDLKELYDNKLRLIYIGLESGNQDILNQCNKRSSAQEMIDAVKKAYNAGIKSSVIVLLGLGGKKHSKKHVKDTIKALNLMQPRYLSFLSLIIIPGTPIYEKVKKHEFKELDAIELLKESYDIIEGLDLKKTIFRSNHASNYLSLEGTLPKDKERLINILKKAIDGKIKLKPELFRRL